ncbi:AbrB/MazE/SpoVT family DNA-binding domain-containing protein [Rhodoferax sp.]|uniref:AbrB/MazE/SpoVT family DNA-binding domain-containing protein n=1 Tax=Rhodoferax sp. TaxID=50421 RepID=UPI002613B717|nr:AbrB/MazE/SpoVT family DNA-binding domain-containing protein [Rhodoferax sp.]MDD2808300.1 AbrB/MazE/SpoVT family DNA-binding domain-containing protein [Rhodoferax sp.]MDD5478189.1 AbrB/MazE/SpoVT family DNA-binding domain-containing protein [Rhodoferax sp.]
MGYALTVKGQVTLPKAIRDFLGVSPGQEIDYEALSDGRVVIFPVRRQAAQSNPYQQLLGVGLRKRPTDEIMRETRGEDWNR